MREGAIKLPADSGTSRRTVERRVLDQATQFEELLAKRSHAELRLRTLTEQIEKSGSWLPQLAIMRPDQHPAEFLGGLRKRRSELIKHIAELNRLERDQFGEMPDRFQFEPSRADIEAMKQHMDVLESLRGAYRAGPYTWDGEPEAPTGWSAVLWSFRATEYPGIWWTEDDDATYSKQWSFDPYYDVYRGILYGRFSVDNPAPFDWPLYEEEHDWSQLMVALALEFDIPAQDFDAQVFYEANMVLGISPFYDARDHYHYVSAIACEQADASTGAPASLSDFDHVGEAIQNTPDHFEQVRPVDVARTYSVRAGVSSRIHLGFTWNLSVASGIAGTANGCWDNLVIFPPTADDVWGVQVTVVPV